MPPHTTTVITAGADKASSAVKPAEPALPPVAADFLRRLRAAKADRTLPFTLTEPAEGWLLPYQDAMRWYTELTGLSISAVVTALTRPTAGGAEPLAVLNQCQGRPPQLLIRLPDKDKQLPE